MRAAHSLDGVWQARLERIESQPVDNYAQGNSPRGGEPLLISEWGNWALPDPARARERSGGRDPHWFGKANHPLLDDMKTVAGFEERFERLGLDPTATLLLNRLVDIVRAG
jgi:hypothetical protein